MHVLAVGLILLASAVAPPDEAHWKGVVSLQQKLLRISPTGDPDEAIAVRRDLVQRTRSYQSLYPGGDRFQDATRLELQTRFEIGTLQRGALDELRTRCEELLRSPRRDAQAEGAYWLMLQNRSVNLEVDVLRRSFEVFEQYRAFCRTYPESLYTPRLSEVLFAQAEVDNDAKALEEIVQRLEKAHPGHLTTELLRGGLDLRAAVGKPFFVSGVDSNGAPIDSRLARGQVCLIVFWSSAAAPEGFVTRVEQERTRGNLVVIDVDLATHPNDSKPIQWKHLHDRLGPAHRLARRWGVRTTPSVLVIDSTGRLLGRGNDASWLRLLPGEPGRISPDD